MRLRIEGGTKLVGELRVPADKSVVHRGLLLGALGDGETTISAATLGEDNQSTARVLRGLGVEIEASGASLRVLGKGPSALRAPSVPLDCGNSGTTIRMVAGILGGRGLVAEMFGDASLSRRPMGRVCKPLRELGADIAGVKDGDRELPPLKAAAGNFRGGPVRLDVASAQVKSAVLLAGVASGQAVEVTEPSMTRDHTERLLQAMGAPLGQSRYEQTHRVVLGGGAHLRGVQLVTPGDFSSAAFFLAAGALVPESKILLRDVGLNPTRTGLLEILEELGARVHVGNWHEVAGEPRGDLTATPGAMRATRPGDVPLRVSGPIIPRLIDELVVLAAVLSQADGATEITDAAELRVKESDRIDETVRILAAFGVQATARPDGLVVRGPQPLRVARLDVSSDHRVAMAAAVLALAAPGESVLEGFEVAAVSYPGFVADLERLGAKVRVE